MKKLLVAIAILSAGFAASRGQTVPPPAVFLASPPSVAATPPIWKIASIQSPTKSISARRSLGPIARSSALRISPGMSARAITDPTVLSGLRLWLKADGLSAGALSTWADLSGMANDAIQLDPDLQPVVVTNQLNGLPVVRFDGTNDTFSLPDLMNGATAGEIIAVLKITDRPDYWNSPWGFGLSYGSGYINEDRHDDFGIDEFNGFPAVNSSLRIQYHIDNVSVEDGEWVNRFNGRERHRLIGESVVWRSSPTIGDGLFDGDIAEIIIYDRVLTSAERESVGGYLAAKYAPSSIEVPNKPVLSAFAAASTISDLSWTFSVTAGVVTTLERQTGGGSFVTVAEFSDLFGTVDAGLTANTSYTYRVKQRTYAGSSVYSDPITITTLSVAGTPPPSSGLRLWLRSTAGIQGFGPLGLWLDQSGLNNHALQENPGDRPNLVANQLNGFPVVRFNGGYESLFLTDVMNGAVIGEIIAYIKYTPVAPDTFNNLWHFGTGYGTGYFNNDSYEDFGTSEVNFHVGWSSPTQYHAKDVSFNAGTLTERINNTPFWNATSQPLSFNTAPFFGGGFHGDIAEVLIYDRELSSTERDAVHAYFSAKYISIDSLSPSIPSGLDDSAVAATSFTVTWTPSTDNIAVTHYDIYVDGVLVGSSNTETYDVVGLAPSTVYNITVKARDAAGNISGASATLPVTTGADSNPPSAPSMVSASEITRTTATITWNASSDNVAVTAYDVYNGVTLVGSPSTSSFNLDGLTAASNYTITVNARDAAGNVSSASAPLSITTVVDGIPATLSGLRLWLQAALAPAGPLDSWVDQSGLGNNAIQVAAAQRPSSVAGVLNGLSVIRFDGSDDAFDLPDFMAAASAGEVFIVLKAAQDDTSGTNRGLWRMGTDFFGGYYPDGIGRILDEFGTTAAKVVGNPSAPLDQFNLYNVSSATGDWTARFNGVVATTSNSNTVAFRDDPALGRNFAEFFHGDIAEVIIYHRVLTTTERDSVVAYLNAKYQVFDAVVPTAPVGLTVSAVTAVSVTLAWSPSSDNVGVTGYDIFRNNVLIGSSVGNSFTASGLSPATSYAFTVRAKDAAGNSSSYSSTFSAATLAGVPYATHFESSDGFSVGGLNLQGGWSVPLGAAEVVTAGSYVGAQHIMLVSGPIAAEIEHPFGPTLSNPPIVFADLNLRPVAGVSVDEGTRIGVSTAQIAFVKNGTTGEFRVLDGDGGGGGSWISLLGAVELSAGDVSTYWQRLTVRLNYTSKKWDLYHQGVLVACDLGFSDSSATYFANVSLKGHAGTATRFDGIVVAVENPLFIDFDRDGLPDSWEVSHGLSASSDDRALDFDGDGLTNVREYYIGTRADDADTDGDGLADGAELMNASDPLTPGGGAGAIVGKRIWLKAGVGITMDGAGNVSGWADLSGNGMNATQTSSSDRPAVIAGALNGRAVVRFDGPSDHFVLPDLMTLATAGEVFIVFKALHASAPFAPYFNGYGLWRFSGSAITSGNEGFVPNGSGEISETFGRASRVLVGSPAALINQPTLYNVVSAPTEWTARVNGAVEYTTSTNLVSFRSNPLLGKSDGNYSSGFRGDIAEIIIFDRMLNPNERDAINEYLGVKYALPELEAPPSPNNIKGAALSPTTVQLTWTGNSVGVKYIIERKEGPGGLWSVVGESRDSFGFLDEDLSPGTSYVYRVVASRGRGASASSIEVSATTRIAGTPELPTVGMRLWLKADNVTRSGGGTVQRWRDDSGNDNDVVQDARETRPLLVNNAVNGRPGIQFSGVQHLALSDVMAGATAGDAFVVLKSEYNAAPHAPYFNGYGLWRFSAGNAPLGSGGVFPDGSGGINEDFGRSDPVALGKPIATLSSPLLYNVVSSSSEWTARFNGAIQKTVSTNTVGFRSDPVLGAHFGYYSQGFRGDVAEIVMYDRVLSDSEREAVGQYLSIKYALTGLPRAPLNLTVRLSSSQPLLEWEAVDNALSYLVERRSSGGAFTAIAEINVGANGLHAYTDSSAPPNNIVEYRVRVKNYIGLSDYSRTAYLVRSNSSDDNGNKLLDYLEVRIGLDPTSEDSDGDGIQNTVEVTNGTNPNNEDSDHDGTEDAADYYPMDPLRSNPPVLNPNDMIAPVITLTSPVQATLN